METKLEELENRIAAEKKAPRKPKDDESGERARPARPHPMDLLAGLLASSKKLSQSLDVYLDDPDNDAAWNSLKADMEEHEMMIVTVENGMP